MKLVGYLVKSRRGEGKYDIVIKVPFNDADIDSLYYPERTSSIDYNPVNEEILKSIRWTMTGEWVNNMERVGSRDWYAWLIPRWREKIHKIPGSDMDIVSYLGISFSYGGPEDKDILGSMKIEKLGRIKQGLERKIREGEISARQALLMRVLYEM